MSTTLFQYTLHLADSALILAQRNAEWTGHGPVLEQDIAITNIALDLLGQARNFYQYAATRYNHFNTDEKSEIDFLVPQPWKEFHRELNEDDLAFLRDANQFRNLLLNELPKGDWAQTILRQCFFSAFQLSLYEGLKKCPDAALAAIAEKAAKEVQYHLRWSSEWVIRLGDGTDESNRRINNALQTLWPFTSELFSLAAYEETVLTSWQVDMGVLKSLWQQQIQAVFAEATLVVSQEGAMQLGGKEGRHTKYLAPLLADMQELQRIHPNAVW